MVLVSGGEQGIPPAAAAQIVIVALAIGLVTPLTAFSAVCEGAKAPWPKAKELNATAKSKRCRNRVISQLLKIGVTARKLTGFGERVKSGFVTLAIPPVAGHKTCRVNVAVAPGL